MFARAGLTATETAVGAGNGGDARGGANGVGSCVGVGARTVGLVVGVIGIEVGVEEGLIGRAAIDADPAVSASFTDFWLAEADPLVSGGVRGDTTGSAVFFGTPVGTTALSDWGDGLLSVGSGVCFGFVSTATRDWTGAGTEVRVGDAASTTVGIPERTAKLVPARSRRNGVDDHALWPRPILCCFDIHKQSSE